MTYKVLGFLGLGSQAPVHPGYDFSQKRNQPSTPTYLLHSVYRHIHVCLYREKPYKFMNIHIYIYTICLDKKLYIYIYISVCIYMYIYIYIYGYLRTYVGLCVGIDMYKSHQTQVPAWSRDTCFSVGSPGSLGFGV